MGNVMKYIKKQTEDKPGKFMYKTCNTQIRYALILIDSKWAWWTPYHPGIDVTQTTSFVLVDKGEKSIIKQCKDHFETLWYYLGEKTPNATKTVNGQIN